MNKEILTVLILSLLLLATGTLAYITPKDSFDMRDYYDIYRANIVNGSVINFSTWEDHAGGSYDNLSFLTSESDPNYPGDVWVNETGDSMTGDLFIDADLHLNDSRKVYLGNADDFYLMFDGTDTFLVNDVGDGELIILLDGGGFNISDLMYINGSMTFIGSNAGAGVTGLGNLAIGENALDNECSGTSNIAIGYNSLGAVTTGVGNTGIGAHAGRNIGGAQRNTAIGYQSLYSSSAGNSNVAIGYQTLFYATGGSGNVGIGTYAGFSMTTGIRNVAIGLYALKSLTTEGGCIAIGERSLYYATGGYNTGIGYRSLYRTNSGYSNVAIGYQAGYQNRGGLSNVFIGTSTGYGVNGASYSENTAIGRGAGTSFVDGQDGCVFLGHRAGYYETAGNTLMIDNAQRANEADARAKALIYGKFDADPANQNLTVNANTYVVGTVDATDFECDNCITSDDVLDIDAIDIEGDINTFVDIPGDTMTGTLVMGGKILQIGNSQGNQTIYFYADGSATGQAFGYRQDLDVLFASDSLTAGGTISGDYIFSTNNVIAGGDIFTMGASDDLWLGAYSQASAPFKAYADGHLDIAAGAFKVNQTGYPTIGSGSSQIGITMTSPNNSEWCVKVWNDGVVNGTAGAC